MPCFNTLFAFAFTALAALSSAAPVASGANQVAQVVDLPNVANNLLQNVEVSEVHVNALNVDRRQVDEAAQLVNVADALNNLGQHVDVSGVDVEVLNVVHQVAKREEPQPIAAILLQAKAKLEAITSKLNVIVKAKAKAEVNLDDLSVILDEVHDTLLAALASVKAIVGQSTTFIFNHQGKIWTAAEVGSLLVSVVVNVLYILSLVLYAVVSASHKAALARVTVVADVMADLLQTIFVDLNVGIFATTRSQLTDALLKVWSSLDLDTIVDVLKNGHL